MNKYLIRKDYVLKGGLKESEDENTIIPFDNIRVEVGSADPSKVVLLSKEEVLALAQELQDTIGNLKYNQFYDKSNGEGTDYANAIPTAAELNALYNGNGIVVENIDTGQTETLQATTNPVKDTDSILFHELSSGVFEEGIFQGGQWLISQIKNSLPTAIANLDSKISSNTIDINDHETRIKSIETDNADTTGDIVRITNNKDIVSKGAISAGDATITDGGKIPTREDVRSALTHLAKGNKTLQEIETEQDAQGVRITANEDHLTNVDAEQTNHDTRLTALESNPTANYVTAFRKWTGSQGGSATDAGDMTTTIDLSGLTSDDGSAFDFTAGSDFTIWFESTMAGNKLELNELIQSGRTVPQVIEVIRESTGNSIAVLYAMLDTTGKLTITRSEGDEIDFTSIKVNEISETVRTAATNIVTKTDLATVSQTATEADTRSKTNETNIADNITKINLKQDKLDNSLTTTSKAITGAINELKTDITHADQKIANNKSDIEEITNSGRIKSDSGTRDLTLPNVSGILGLESVEIELKEQVGATSIITANRLAFVPIASLIPSSGYNAVDVYLDFGNSNRAMTTLSLIDNNAQSVTSGDKYGGASTTDGGRLNMLELRYNPSNHRIEADSFDQLKFSKSHDGTITWKAESRDFSTHVHVYRLVFHKYRK